MGGRPAVHLPARNFAEAARKGFTRVAKELAADPEVARRAAPAPPSVPPSLREPYRRLLEAAGPGARGKLTLAPVEIRVAQTRAAPGDTAASPVRVTPAKGYVGVYRYAKPSQGRVTRGILAEAFVRRQSPTA